MLQVCTQVLAWASSYKKCAVSLGNRQPMRYAHVHCGCPQAGVDASRLVLVQFFAVLAQFVQHWIVSSLLQHCVVWLTKAQGHTKSGS